MTKKMISLDTLKDEIFSHFDPYIVPTIEPKYFIYHRLHTLLKIIYRNIHSTRLMMLGSNKTVRIRLYLDTNFNNYADKYRTDKYCEMIFILGVMDVKEFMYYNVDGNLTEKYYYGKWEKTQVIKYLRIPELNI